MYLIGAELIGNTGFASMVLVQRVRRELRKYYHVLDIKRSAFNPDATNFVEAIERIYNDPKFTIRKPRFSQIGRPKKMINEKPLIFAGCYQDSPKWIKDLKMRGIPVNLVFINDEEKWYTQTPGKCLKSDYYIPKKILIKTILAVIKENRLVIHIEEVTPALLETDKEYNEIEDKSIQTNTIKPFDDVALALAMPVWYYENLLSIRPRTP